MNLTGEDPMVWRVLIHKLLTLEEIVWRKHQPCIRCAGVDVGHDAECKNSGFARGLTISKTPTRGGDWAAYETGRKEERVFYLLDERCKAVVELCDEELLASAVEAEFGPEPIQARSHCPTVHLAEDLDLGGVEFVKWHTNGWKQVRGIFADQNVEESPNQGTYGEACHMHPRF